MVSCSRVYAAGHNTRVSIRATECSTLASVPVRSVCGGVTRREGLSGLFERESGRNLDSHRACTDLSPPLPARYTRRLAVNRVITVAFRGERLALPGANPTSLAAPAACLDPEPTPA